MSNSKVALQILDKQLRCGCCGNLFTDPRQLLGCQDTFCLSCINGFTKSTKDDKVFVRCPTCLNDSPLPKSGTEGLKVNKVILNLFDLRRELISEAVSTGGGQGNLQNDEFCPDHSEPLKVYCETCSKVICRDCTISLNHSSHLFYLVSECYHKHCQELETELALVRDKIAAMSEVVADIKSVEQEIAKEKENIKDNVEAYAQEIMELVQMSKEKLFSEIEDLARRKKDTLTRQKSEALRLLDSLKKCEELVDSNIRELSQPQVLMKKQIMQCEMRKAYCDAEPTVFQPLENVDMIFGRNLNILSDQNIGELACTVFDKALVNLGPCVAQKLSTTILTIKSHDERPLPLPAKLVTCKIIPPDTSQNVDSSPSVSEIGTGEFAISYTLSDEGEHKLAIQVGGIDVAGSPFSLVVSEEISSREQGRTITELKQPRGIAICDNGNIVVVESSAHCATILDKDGKTVQTLGQRGVKRDFINPQGLAVYKDKFDEFVFLTDAHRLHKLNVSQNRIVKTVGKTTAGNSQTEFRNPRDVAVHHATGEVFVADSGNNRVQVFKNDITYSYTIDNYHFNQSKDGCFNEPVGLAFDEEGYLYISEYLNHCITKVTARGHFIAKIGKEGSNPGELYGPSSISIYQKYLYVAELGVDRVSIFNTEGTFIRCFWNRGKDNDSATHSIAVDKLGHLYVTDSWNCIVVFH